MNFSWFESIVAGLVQGLLLIIAVGAYHKYQRCRKKKQEREYINKTISLGLEYLLNAKEDRTEVKVYDGNPEVDPDIDYEIGEPIIISRDEVRKNIFHSMYKELDAFITHRTKELSFEEERTIRNAFGRTSRIIIEGNANLTPCGYRSFLIEQLQSIEWLELEDLSQRFRKSGKE